MVLFVKDGSWRGGVESLVIGGVTFGVGTSTENTCGVDSVKGSGERSGMSTRPNGNGSDGCGVEDGTKFEAEFLD
jgi:hypothetical protein